ncbi:MAG: hypothetical protein IH905_09050 [Proteobacteria bacterium]|nr:hypothetical protein [Pseudomonadota bacterium]
MSSDKEKAPPGGSGAPLKDVLAVGFDFSRDNLTGPKKQVAAAPADFDPAACPILAEHFFGTEGAPPVGVTTAEVVTGLRRERQIEHVYLLGLRAVGELLYEVAEGGDLDRALDAYERLTPSMLKAVGADRFPPVLIYQVEP